MGVFHSLSAQTYPGGDPLQNYPSEMIEGRILHIAEAFNLEVGESIKVHPDHVVISGNVIAALCGYVEITKTETGIRHKFSYLPDYQFFNCRTQSGVKDRKDVCGCTSAYLH